VRRSLVRDLAPLVSGDAAFDPADFYAPLLDAYRWDGGTWALPVAATFQLIYYDRAAFEAASVPCLSPAGRGTGSSTRRARSRCARMARWLVGAGSKRWPNPSLLVEGQAGPLADYTVSPPAPRLDAPEVAEAVDWYAASTGWSGWRRTPPRTRPGT